MKPQAILDRAKTPDGTEIVLIKRDDVYSIRVDGLELMSSRAHGSEEALARLVLSDINHEGRPRILVGGLGMGFTLRAALDFRPPVFEVVVAEILGAVVLWNQSTVGHLARAPLDDPRVRLVEGDVADVIAGGRQAFDAVLLDVDNGPSAFTVDRNESLYGPAGLAAIHGCLQPRGVLGVWSADPAPEFLRLLNDQAFDTRVEQVRARGPAKGPIHTIFIARRR